MNYWKAIKNGRIRVETGVLMERQVLNADHELLVRDGFKALHELYERAELAVKLLVKHEGLTPISVANTLRAGACMNVAEALDMRNALYEFGGNFTPSEQIRATAEAFGVGMWLVKGAHDALAMFSRDPTRAIGSARKLAETLRLTSGEIGMLPHNASLQDRMVMPTMYKVLIALTLHEYENGHRGHEYQKALQKDAMLLCNDAKRKSLPTKEAAHMCAGLSNGERLDVRRLIGGTFADELQCLSQRLVWGDTGFDNEARADLVIGEFTNSQQDSLAAR